MESINSKKSKINIHKLLNWLILGLFMVTCTPTEIQENTIENPCVPVDSVNVIDSINYITKYKVIPVYKEITREVTKTIYDTTEVIVRDTIIIQELYSIDIESLTEYEPCEPDTVFIIKDRCGIICRIFKNK